MQSTDLEKFVADIFKYIGFLLIIPAGKLFNIIVYGEGELTLAALAGAIVSLCIALIFFYIGYMIMKRRSFTDGT